MRKGPGGIDEFKIARAFGAVAVMVALYGVTLSATALVEQPVARSAQPLRWYEQTEPAKPRQSASSNVVERDVSFWTSAKPKARALPPSAREPRTRIASFWAPRDPVRSDDLKLASSLEQPKDQF
ncbi:MAG: hypothetical protein LJE97_01555 [Betaproteobacteria bacterium]|jgi:hypothetical protein|nr:hypothetical protein [Betaproteobacteria bacterium]